MAVYTHSLGIFFAYAIGSLAFYYRTSRRGLWKSAYGDALVVAIPGVLLGSRLGWALPFWLSGRPTPPGQLTTLVFTHITFLGGVIGGVAFGFAWVALRKESFSPVLGVLVESILLGQFVGRIGDLLVADHLGKPTTSPLGFQVPAGWFRPNGACMRAGEVCHQTALYEFVIAGGLLLLTVLYRRRGLSEQRLAALLLVGYGALRFGLVEPFRMTTRLAGLTGSQWTSLGLLALGLILVLRTSPTTSMNASSSGESSGRSAQDSPS